jgi:FkbM family methyltransferase
LLDRFRRRLEVLRNQPVARHQPIKVLLRFANAEIINAWLRYPFIVSHEFGALLIVEKGHHATRSHYFFGLQDFVDELFAIHFLREDELFIDIGANLGIFSIMVAAATRARVIAVEPSPSSSRVFKRHIALNDLMDRITVVEACAGDSNVAAFIKNTVDMDNFIVLASTDSQPDMARIPMIRIDDVVDGTIPSVMKMDVEGFEMQALKGATRLLDSQNLQAITVEISDLSNRFGVSPEETHKFIASFGFTTVTYDPLTRELSAVAPADRSRRMTLYNYKTIFVRNLEEARRRLSSAPRRTLHTLTI